MELERYETPNMEVMSFGEENIICASTAEDFIKSADESLGQIQATSLFE